ncbi:hypothetical protein POSPLADRAFT_1055237 [Postia placenta MAD-698-R-SB12]|uniref:Uncharacterized protein n=1 Tax=Postia placenta MAD-698-R-SB12 TaxID=670580 RepID=A0A1X6N406_9APHY|nr:hypothetical protein POSPLADRAFT_1055237 [Postia placenta MAD-698-R-SB12]OSX63172.1 hypothetical protein POSPLADRAFT_1055237 [Postia placenta MAD-698-R-SB12]
MAADNDSIKSGTSSQRSVSRGRDFQSSGRGGVGNIRRTSIDPNCPKTPNFNPEDDVTMNRGREPAQAGDKDRVSVFALQCSFFPFDFVPPSRPSFFELIARDRVFADIPFFVILFRVQIPDRLPTRGLACEPSRSSLVLTTTHRHGRATDVGQNHVPLREGHQTPHALLKT